MIKHEYYDSKTGRLNAACQWQMAFNQNASKTAHYEAKKYAATFVDHPSIDPFEAYCSKFKELSNIKPVTIKPLYEEVV